MKYLVWESIPHEGIIHNECATWEEAVAMVQRSAKTKQQFNQWMKGKVVQIETSCNGEIFVTSMPVNENSK